MRTSAGGRAQFAQAEADGVRAFPDTQLLQLDAAAMSQIEAQVGGFAQHHKIGLDPLFFDQVADRDAFAGFFLYHEGHVQAAPQAGPGGCQQPDAVDHRGQCPLHVRCPAAEEHAIHDITAERITGPCAAVADVHCVHVAIVEQHGALAAAVATHHIADAVNPHLVKPAGPHGLQQDCRYSAFSAWQAGRTDQVLRQACQPLCVCGGKGDHVLTLRIQRSNRLPRRKAVAEWCAT